MAPLLSVTLHGKTYNCHIDVEARSIWLEDNDSKRQWKWLGAKSELPVQHEHGENAVPEAVALPAIQRMLASAPYSYSNGNVELVDSDRVSGGLRLTLRVPVTRADLAVTRVFELRPIALDDAQLSLAHQQQTHKTLHELAKQLKDVKQQLATARAERVAADVSVKRLLEDISGATACLLFLACAAILISAVVSMVKAN